MGTGKKKKSSQIARSSRDGSGGRCAAMQCHKDGCGSFGIQSGPFKMLYHGQHLNTLVIKALELVRSTGDLALEPNCGLPH